MVRFFLQGRMGNQMFQFAFAKLFAKKLGTKALLDFTHESFSLNLFQLPGGWGLLEQKFFEKVYNKTQKLFLKNAPIIDLRDCFQELDIEVFQDNKGYKGYFQDHRFFINHKETLRNWFTLKEKYKQNFNRLYQNRLKEKRAVVVHFRLRDYNSFQPFFVEGRPPILPTEWYYKILDRFNPLQYNIFCISDDIEKVKETFRPAGYKIEYVEEDVATDFLLLSHADICIISNSTFAWWGAFLNARAEYIFCPKHFLGFLMEKEVPPHIYPNNWIQVEVDINKPLRN